MADIAVDTCVLLDVLLDDPAHAAASQRALDRESRRGRLLIGPATLAELATVFARSGADLDAFLDASGLVVTPLRDEDAVAAGRAFAKRLDDRHGCPDCGGEVVCKACDRTVQRRHRIITDHLIAAHARSAGRLLTRDAGMRMAGVKIVRP